MSSYDPTDLRGQQQDKQEQDARKRLQRELEIADIKWLLKTRRGRRIMWRLLSIAGVFRASFNANAMQMAFNEGNRNMGNILLDELLELAPEAFPLMMEEQHNERDGNGNQSK